MKRAFIVVFLAAASLRAHEESVDRGTIVVSKATAKIRLTLPSSDFAAFDDDRDGALSPVEIDRHRNALDRWIDKRLRIVDQDGRAGRTVLADIVVPLDHRATSVTIVRHLRWTSAPRSIDARFVSERRVSLEVSGMSGVLLTVR